VQSGQEHHQAYRISWSEGQTNFTHRSDVFAFRGEAPPRFLVDVGKRYVLVQESDPHHRTRLEQAPCRVRARMFCLGQPAGGI
jgi:hypothetical protein